MESFSLKNRKLIEQAAGVALVGVLVFFCLLVLKPFVSAMLWAAILVFASWPAYGFVRRRLTGGNAVAAAVALWMTREKARGDVIALAMILGGALGNIIDRVRFGYVVDFADLHFGAFRPFMIFNVADACITLGVLLLVARALLLGEKAPPAAESAGDLAAKE